MPPEADAVVAALTVIVARLTDAIADELVPFAPATWEQLYRSRGQG